MPDDEIDDRLSRRFEGTHDGESQTAESADTSETDMSSQPSQKAQNIKKEWNVRSFYLPDDLDSELATAFKRLDLEFAESDTGVDLKKTRHFYPLVVRLGLEALEGKEITEVIEELEGTDR